MSGISFSKENLQSALNNANEVIDSISSEITKIRENLETIESNWSGPIHDEANADKTNAEGNLKDADTVINSIKESLTTLNTNAQNVNYNS